MADDVAVAARRISPSIARAVVVVVRAAVRIAET